MQHSCFVYMFNNYGMMHKSLGLGQTELLWLAKNNAYFDVSGTLKTRQQQ